MIACLLLGSVGVDLVENGSEPERRFYEGQTIIKREIFPRREAHPSLAITILKVTTQLCPFLCLLRV